jgi:hypothetical protein
MIWKLQPENEEPGISSDTSLPSPQNKEESIQNKWQLQPVEEKKDSASTIGKYGALTAAPVLEQLGGAPQDIKEGISNALIGLYENSSLGFPENYKFPQVKGDSIFEDLKNVYKDFNSDPAKQREAPTWLKNILGVGKPENSPGQLPSSRQIRKVFSETSGGYTEPEKGNYIQEKYRNFVSDFTNLTVVPTRFRMSPTRRIGTAIGSELLGDTAKAISGKESDKQKVKAGSTFLFSVLNPGGARRYVSGMYDDVRRNIPANLSANSMHTVQELDNLERALMRSGIATNTTTSVLTPLNQLRDTIMNQGGNMPVHALMDAKVRINELRSRFYANTPTAAERGLARREFSNLMRVVDRSIENGLRGHPEELARFQNANQAWTVLHEGVDASRFVNRIIPHQMRGSAMAAIFEIASGNPALAGKLAIGAASTLGIVTGTRLMTQVMNSPTLRRYYIDTTRHALMGNSKATLESWNKLNEAWEIEQHNEKVRNKH